MNCCIGWQDKMVGPSKSGVTLVWKLPLYGGMSMKARQYINMGMGMAALFLREGDTLATRRIPTMREDCGDSRLVGTR